MSKKPKTSKQLFPHTKKKMYERYGIEINKSIYEELCMKIRTFKPDIKKLYSQSHSKSVYGIIYQEKLIVVVYDEKRKLITTALPPECEDPNKNFYIKAEIA